MINKMRIIILYLFALFGLIVIVLHIIGYRLVKQDNIIPDWNAIGAITNIFVVISTLIAVLAAIEPIKIKLSMSFFMLHNNFYDLSLANSQPKLIITNTCSKTIVLHNISIMHGKKNHISINLISDEVDRPFICKVNDIDFKKLQPITINPSETKIVEFSVISLDYIFGHVCDPPNGKEKDESMYISVTESFGKKISFNTKITYGQYYENLIRIQNELYN